MLRRIILLASIGLLLAGHAQARDSADGCRAMKLKAAMHGAADKLSCFRKAMDRSVPLDPSCLAAAEARLSSAVARADARGGCALVGEARLLQADVDAFFDRLLERENDAAVCGLSGTFCGTTPCCPGYTCILDPILFVSTCM